MSETDVARTLTEIRERVRVQLRAQLRSTETQSSGSVISGPNTQIESLRANLSIIERSRNRLPPVTSYRQGWIAGLELSVKRLFKKITHWFTWEQVNFNAATANSLQEILMVLSFHEEVLAEIRSQLEKPAASPAEIQMLTHSAQYRGNHFQNGSTSGVSALTPVDEITNSEIDLEINRLAARLEELRAAKMRMG